MLDEFFPDRGILGKLSEKISVVAGRNTLPRRSKRRFKARESGPVIYRRWWKTAFVTEMDLVLVNDRWPYQVLDFLVNGE